MSAMQDEMGMIAGKVRGIAAEKRLTQARIAEILGIDRKSVNARMNAQTAFTAVEILRLAMALDVDIRRFYPVPAEVRRVVAA